MFLLDSLDLMVAATARRHDLIVVTRNRRDFDRMGVGRFDPYRPVG